MFLRKTRYKWKMDGHMDRQTDDQMDILMVGQND